MRSQGRRVADPGHCLITADGSERPSDRSGCSRAVLESRTNPPVGFGDDHLLDGLSVFTGAKLRFSGRADVQIGSNQFTATLPSGSIDFFPKFVRTLNLTSPQISGVLSVRLVTSFCQRKSLLPATPSAWPPTGGHSRKSFSPLSKLSGHRL